MKNILIIGSSSYIGRSFESYMKENGSGEQAIEFLSLRDDEAWKFTNFQKYDSILFLAAIVHKKEKPKTKNLCFKLNCDLAYEVALKAKGSGVRQFVYLSTMAVYGMSQGRITPGTKLAPDTLYGQSKLAGERKLLALGCKSALENTGDFKLCIVRPPMVYGPDCPGNYTKLRNLVLKYTMFPQMENMRSMIYVGNLCEFLRILMNECVSGIFHPQNKKYVDTCEMANEIAKANGLNLHRIKLLGVLLAPFVGSSLTLSKVFGNLTYSSSMSSFLLCHEDGDTRELDYQRFEFEESIRLSEERKKRL